jgi:hypothetical protein
MTSTYSSGIDGVAALRREECGEREEESNEEDITSYLNRSPNGFGWLDNGLSKNAEYKVCKQ